MKKTSVKILFLLGLGLLSACSSNSSLEVGVPTAIAFMVPSTRQSCKLAYANVGATSPAPDDVSASYFQFDRVNFKWGDPSSNLKIQRVTFNFEDTTLPGGKINCAIAGEDLNAINSLWQTRKEAVIGSRPMLNLDGTLRYTPTYIMSADCALICGGFTVTTSFSVTGTMEITGIQVDDFGSAQNKPAVHITTAVTIAN